MQQPPQTREANGGRIRARIFGRLRNAAQESVVLGNGLSFRMVRPPDITPSALLDGVLGG
jgi:hypothetical protein